jgi:hypothetical protein
MANLTAVTVARDQKLEIEQRAKIHSISLLSTVQTPDPASQLPLKGLWAVVAQSPSQDIAKLFGLPSSAGGQFVSGASMANLTAVTVARDQKLEIELDSADSRSGLPAATERVMGCGSTISQPR